jgi:DnaK suppressor protein
MTSLNRNELITLRALLTARLKALDFDLQHARRAQLEQALDGLPRDVMDTDEEAAREQTAGCESAELKRDLVERNEVDAALTRMDLGTYGLCVQCGEPVPTPRLMARPAAMRCAPCQVISERRRRPTDPPWAC